MTAGRARTVKMRHADADSFFAVHITGWEGAEMRRWLRDHTWAVRPPREAAETWLELLSATANGVNQSPARNPRE